MQHLQIIRPRELAELLSISIPTLYRIQKELPPKIKLTENGRAVGWLKSDIEQYIQNRNANQNKKGLSESTGQP